MPGFQSFFRFLHHFVLANLASSSIRVKVSTEKPAQCNDGNSQMLVDSQLSLAIGNQLKLLSVGP